MNLSEKAIQSNGSVRLLSCNRVLSSEPWLCGGVVLNLGAELRGASGLSRKRKRFPSSSR